MPEQHQANRLGSANYHDIFKSFLPGWIRNVQNDINSEPSHETWRWSAFILPRLDQAPLHERLQISDLALEQVLGSGMSGTAPLLQTGLTVYRCPTDPGGNQSSQLVHTINSSVRIRDITDGTSNTFLVGERGISKCRGGTWIGTRNPLTRTGSRGQYTLVGGAHGVTLVLNAPP